MAGLGRDPLQALYLLALVVAPAAFLVGALLAYRSGDLVDAAGFLLLTAMVGGLSLHFWRTD